MTKSEKAHLIIPIDKASNKISTQIDRGRELLQIRITSREILESVEAEFRAWRDFTRELLNRVFSTDELANEFYNPHGPWGTVVNFGQPPNLHQDTNELHQKLQTRLERLNSIYQRLELFNLGSVGQKNNLLDSETKNIEFHSMLESTPFLSSDEVMAARRMSELYIVLHCYENSVRRLIETVLLGKLGSDWWDKASSQSMRNYVEGRKKQEEKKKWLSPRGNASPLYYLEWGDLEKLIRKYEGLFLPHIGELRFVESRFGDLENLRHIVAHHGVLPSDDDFQRIQLSFRDWCRQVDSVE